MEKNTTKQTKSAQKIANLSSTLSFENPLQEKIDYLEARIKKLSDICNEINPYAQISSDLQKRLKEFHILDLSDPFQITNQLLVQLEDTIDELHLIKPFNQDESPVKEIL